MILALENSIKCLIFFTTQTKPAILSSISQ